MYFKGPRSVFPGYSQQSSGVGPQEETHQISGLVAIGFLCCML